MFSDSAWYAICMGFIILAAGLDLVANTFLMLSQGFTRLIYGVGALVCISLALWCLSYAITAIDLSVAYALWGAFGILGTSIIGWLCFGQRVNARGWFGIVCLLAGVAILNIF